jgi:hypothetical protein
MPEQKETQGHPGYAENVKEIILDALENGTSVLQQPRKAGLGYISNYDSGSIPQGFNQLLLQQVMKDKGFTVPLYSSLDQCDKHGFHVKKGEKSTPISFWASVMRYDRDIPKKDPQGNIVKDQNGRAIIEYKKGDAKLDAQGKKFSGHTFVNAFFVEQQELSFKTFRENARIENGKSVPGFIDTPSFLSIKEKIDLPTPFVDKETGKSITTPGAHYVAKDTSAMEVFAEKWSKFANSLYSPSGSAADYEGWNPSKKELAELRTAITDSKSPVFSMVLDADLIANGRTDKLDQINENRAKKQNQAEQAQGHGR